jgi:hypothetical protein
VKGSGKSFIRKSKSVSSLDSLNTIQLLWVEGRLSKVERLCVQSFLDHGFEVHLYHYGPLEAVPTGATLKDGRTILGESHVFRSDSLKGSGFLGFANRFRYHMLYEKGGWWFDMDSVCLRSFEPPEDLTFASTWEGKWGNCANNNTLWCKPGDERMRMIRDEAERVLREGDLSLGAAGFKLLQRMVSENNWKPNVSESFVFAPYHWSMLHRILPKTFKDYAKDQIRMIKHRIWQLYRPHFRAGYIRKQTLSLHLCNELWKANGYDKNGSYYRLGLFEQLKSRHGIR